MHWSMYVTTRHNKHTHNESQATLESHDVAARGVSTHTHTFLGLVILQSSHTSQGWLHKGTHRYTKGMQALLLQARPLVRLLQQPVVLTHIKAPPPCLSHPTKAACLPCLPQVKSN